MALLQRRHGGTDDMEMSASSMISGMDDMNDGTIDVYTFPNVYLAIFGVVVALFTLFNILEWALFRQRLSAVRAGKSSPARPKNILVRAYATLTAVGREVSNATLPQVRIGRFEAPSPAVGRLSLILLNAALLVILGFYALDPSDHQSFQNLAYRWGFLSLGQMPLIFLLAGKNNLVGFLTGTSYERLNWIHRWCSRCLLVTVTLHMGYWFAEWAPYEYIGFQLRNDFYTKTGFSAWCVLLWIVLSSFAPIRGWRYEIFVAQHLVSLLTFTIVVFYHVPASDRVYLWPGIAFFAFDRVVRWMRTANASLKLSGIKTNNTWHTMAQLKALPGGYTKVTIRDPRISWNASQHALLSCHSILPLQSHPFTITSLPEDGRMEFLVKAHTGGTKRLFDFAKKHLRLPSHHGADDASRNTSVPVAVDGPYGTIRPLRQFDSVLLIAGGVGITYTLPLVRELVHQWKGEPPTSSVAFRALRAPDGVVTRYIRFVWVVKSSTEIALFSQQLSLLMNDVALLKAAGKEVSIDMSFYVTCDDTLSQTSKLHYHRQQTLQSPLKGSVVVQTLESDTLPHSSSTKSKLINTDKSVSVREVGLRTSSDDSLAQEGETCGPNGSCCCRMTIKDETADAVSEAAVCNCNCTHNSNALSGSDNELASQPSREDGINSELESSEKPFESKLHASIVLLSGRPHIRTIVRRCLEQALGETGLVSCGPRGLNNDCRQASVALSDERAIHKGTGAQGVWVHTEGYSL